MVLAARRSASVPRRARRDALRVAALGWGVIIVVATALPQAWPPRLSGDGDLVLELGRGGLAEWRALVDDPLSWTSFLLVANVAAYVPLGLLGVLAWPGRVGRVVLAGIALSLAVEASHATLTERVASTDDVVLNVSGLIAGIALGLAVRSLARRVGGAAHAPGTIGEK